MNYSSQLGIVVVAALIIGGLVSCSQSPTKEQEQAVKVMQEAITIREKGDCSRIADLYYSPEPGDIQSKIKHCMRWKDRTEETREGVSMLAAGSAVMAREGQWGKMTDFAKREELKFGPNARLWEDKIDNMYVLKHGKAVAQFYWDGSKLWLLDMRLESLAAS